MTLPKEKEKRVQDMIAELRDIEKYLEEQIIQLQTRLDEHRKRRAILQEFLEISLGVE